jgi:hypothetical protein
VAPATTICRQGRGDVCDPDESCIGLAGAACPADVNFGPLPELTVIKHVINDDGGSALANEWTMDITATNPSDNNFPGQEAPGVMVTTDPGQYSVDESGGPEDYFKTLDAGCSGDLACGDTAECTITNDDLGACIEIEKEVCIFIEDKDGNKNGNFNSNKNSNSSFFKSLFGGNTNTNTNKNNNSSPGGTLVCFDADTIDVAPEVLCDIFIDHNSNKNSNYNSYKSSYSSFSPSLTSGSTNTNTNKNNNGSTDGFGSTCDVEYRLKVTNCGEVDLENVTITDDVLLINVNIGPLAAGEMTDYITSVDTGFENLEQLDICDCCGGGKDSFDSYKSNNFSQSFSLTGGSGNTNKNFNGNKNGNCNGNKNGSCDGGETALENIAQVIGHFDTSFVTDDDPAWVLCTESKDSYDKDGYDKYGYDRDGYDKDGYDRDGYDKNGYNRDGYDKDGNHR